jgi:ABC-type multidrug transport system fused ATPase/permease subunit
MLEVQSGSVKIDGVDLASLSREAVRTNLITVSQDAVFVEGTIRLNMDPHSHASDDTIIDALTNVQLWNLIQENGGLDARSAEMYLSHGQQQLFCLARASIQEGNILLLDEATSRYVTVYHLPCQKCFEEWN